MDNEVWYFTFGIGHPLKDKIQPVRGSYRQARQTMFAIYERNWCSQYGPEEAQELITKYHYQPLPEVQANV